MKIRTRLEYFLAKIAGRDVDISDLNPKHASNATEELLEEIAEKIGGGGFKVGKMYYQSYDGYTVTATEDEAGEHVITYDWFIKNNWDYVYVYTKYTYSDLYEWTCCPMLSLEIFQDRVDVGYVRTEIDESNNKVMQARDSVTVWKE